MRTASCSSSAGMTLSTGPKISSRAIVEWLSTLPNTVGSTKQPAVEVLRAAAAGGERRALGDALGDVALDPVALAVGRRAAPAGSTRRTGRRLDVCEKLAASASTSSSCRLRVTMMRVSDEHTWPFSAHSARASVLAAVAEVDVVEDHRRRLPAELERAARDALAAQRRRCGGPPRSSR